MRVLIVGDSPHISTGFGKINLIAAKTFQAHGWEVASVAALTKEPPKDDKGILTVVPTKDPVGIFDMASTIETFKPDVVYCTADPGSVTMFTHGLPDMPMFSYTFIEGSPIVNRHWRAVLGSVPLIATSQYGAGVIKAELNRDVDYIYNGVDHDTFRVTGIRDDVRRAMKWEDKFVIMCVSTNVKRKQLPRLIEALSILKHRYKQKDVILYLHTVAFQNHWLEGWNLMDIASMYGVEKEVFFHPLMSEFNSSVPESTGEPRKPGLVEMYNAADLFVLPSQVEGFGLPIAEAMACGLPVLVTKYAAGWEVASPAGRGLTISDWEVHKSGTLYANVSVQQMADQILRLKRNPNDRLRMSEASLKRAKDFKWDDFTTRLIPAVEESIVTHQERNAIKEEIDTTEDSDGSSNEHLRQVQAEGVIEESEHLVDRQGEDSSDEESQNQSVETQEEQAKARVEN